MSRKIRVAILDDHQTIIDGYRYRLNGAHDVEIVATALFGEALEPMLASHPTDVLLLDVRVPTAPDNPSPYPILHLIPKILETYSSLAMLVISMYAEHALIKAVMQAGASGYILKDDAATLRELAAVIRTVASDGVYFSQQTYQQLLRHQDESEPLLTPRQLEALSLWAAYPEWSTADLARQLGVTPSTVRNLLSGAYVRLEAHNRAAAIARAQHLGLITPPILPWQSDLSGEDEQKRG